MHQPLQERGHKPKLTRSPASPPRRASGFAVTHTLTNLHTCARKQRVSSFSRRFYREQTQLIISHKKKMRPTHVYGVYGAVGLHMYVICEKRALQTTSLPHHHSSTQNGLFSICPNGRAHTHSSVFMRRLGPMLVSHAQSVRCSRFRASVHMSPVAIFNCC